MFDDNLMFFIIKTKLKMEISILLGGKSPTHIVIYHSQNLLPPDQNDRKLKYVKTNSNSILHFCSMTLKPNSLFVIVIYLWFVFVNRWKVFKELFRQMHSYTTAKFLWLHSLLLYTKIHKNNLTSQKQNKNEIIEECF